MKYYLEETTKSLPYGEVYSCNHILYNKCTLYTIGKKGLCVIQQRYDKKTKHTYWTEIDDWLRDKLYLHQNFKPYFDKYATESNNGLYPTVTIRQIMWALRIKPLKREKWETVFDRCPL